MSVALITGASRGFGRSVARALAGQGWSLVLDARGADALRGVAEEIRSGAGWGGIVALPGDVTDPAHRADLASAAAGFGGLDLLVNNASRLGPSPLPVLADHPLDALTRTYQVDAIAPLGLFQVTATLLRASGGTVVNVSSDAAVAAYAGWGGYGSAKAALDALSAVLAVEEPRLRVYAFDPGDMRTDMHQRAFPGEDIGDRPAPETVLPALLRLLADRPPSGRYRAADLRAPAPVAGDVA
jgi:NAD(P)-dependent dehydrogenase (short-subunit alcohol dehydrogenase family)